MTSPATRIPLIVFGSIAAGSLLGLALVLVVFAAASEGRITGSALVALGAGFAALARASRVTVQPQGWALAPGVATIAVVTTSRPRSEVRTSITSVVVPDRVITSTAS